MVVSVKVRTASEFGSDLRQAATVLRNRAKLFDDAGGDENEVDASNLREWASRIHGYGRSSRPAATGGKARSASANRPSTPLCDQCEYSGGCIITTCPWKIALSTCERFERRA